MPKPRFLLGSHTAPSATLVGDVSLADGASVWYGAVLRGDDAPIVVGRDSNIQDNCVLHAGVTLGARVVVGHACILHGCRVEDECTIGMGSIVLDGALIGHGSIIGAGSLVTKGTVVPPGSLAYGRPARVVRPATAVERAATRQSAAEYARKAARQFAGSSGQSD